MDYRRFLDRTEEVVGPVVHGYAWLADRRARIQGDATPSGWFKVRVRGRDAEALAPASDDERAGALARLPRLRGHAFGTTAGLTLAHGGDGALPVDLAPSDQDPPLLAPLTARRWPVGDLLLWEGVEWEGEAEEQARQALEAGRGLADVKGAPASLRAAFAFAAAEAAARQLGIPAQPVELRRWLRDIADGGRAAAEAALRALARERAAFTEAAAANAAAAAQRARTPAPDTAPLRLEALVEESLRGAGAYLGAMRRLGGGLAEVRWTFLGHRFISVVEERGLQVVDSGVCLAGSDRLVTLDSLPGVIREAIDQDALVITRHAI
jgi:hypothetical protein